MSCIKSNDAFFEGAVFGAFGAAFFGPLYADLTGSVGVLGIATDGRRVSGLVFLRSGVWATENVPRETLEPFFWGVSLDSACLEVTLREGVAPMSASFHTQKNTLSRQTGRNLRY